MPAPSGQSCGTCQFAMIGTVTNALECRHQSPDAPPVSQAIWAPVRSNDWCGDWKPVGYSSSARYLSGSVDLLAGSTTAVLLLTNGGDKLYTAVALRSCQLVSSSNQVRYVRFLDGNSPGNLLTSVAVGPSSSMVVPFAAPIVSLTGSIYVALTSAAGTGDVAVSAQGTKEMP